MHPPLLSAITGDPQIEALLSDEAQLGSMLAFELALARAEGDAGLVTPEAASAIAEAIERFAPDWGDLEAGMARDGVVVPALVAQLRAQIAAPYRAALHKGATSQDVVDTALVLQLAKIAPILLGRLEHVRAKLDELIERNGDQPLLAHTRMQAALPSTIAAKLRTWRDPLEAHRRHIEAMLPELIVLQLGGPVGDRSSFGGKGDAIARAMAAELAIGLGPAWHSTRAPIIGFGQRLALLAGSLGKIGIDVALMAQTETGQVTLSDGGKSSAMPHKTNPVAAEILVALARHATGLAGSLGQAMIHEGERSGSAWTLEWLILPQLIVTTGAGLLTAQRLLGSLAFRL